MTFLQIYTRALRLLAPERGHVIALAIANAAVAMLFFIEPILFGRLIAYVLDAALLGETA